MTVELDKIHELSAAVEWAAREASETREQATDYRDKGDESMARYCESYARRLDVLAAPAKALLANVAGSVP